MNGTVIRAGLADQLDEDLAGDLLAEGPVLTATRQHHWSVERVLLPHLDLDAGSHAQLVEEADDLGVDRAGTATSAMSPGASS